MFHFGWFVGKGYSPHGWNQPWTGTIGSDWMQPDIYMDLARGLERACFDCLVIEDGSFVPDAFQGSPEWYLRNGALATAIGTGEHHPPAVASESCHAPKGPRLPRNP